MSARGFIGSGDLYIARYNPATQEFGALEGPFEATKFEIKPNVDLREQVSRGRTTYGQVIESAALQQPADFTVDLPEVNRQSLAIALLGTESVISQSSGSMSDVAIEAALDKWVDIGYSAIAESGFTVENAASTTTYVEGTDYEVNRRLGWIKALSTGTITEGQDLLINGTYGAVSGVAIRGATDAQVRARFFLDGRNQVDQSDVHVDVYEAVIAADAAFDFLLDQFNTISLPGRMKTPAGRTEPFVVKLLDA